MYAPLRPRLSEENDLQPTHCEVYLPAAASRPLSRPPAREEGEDWEAVRPGCAVGSSLWERCLSETGLNRETAHRRMAASCYSITTAVASCSGLPRTTSEALKGQEGMNLGQLKDMGAEKELCISLVIIASRTYQPRIYRVKEACAQCGESDMSNRSRSTQATLAASRHI